VSFVFLEALCDRCGKCLQQCPELFLNRSKASDEIERLISNNNPKHVLTQCASCFSCNAFCPQSCNPYELILSRWNDRYQSQGSPPLWKFVYPTEESHIWSSLHALLPEQAKKTVEAWMTAAAAETIFLPGSYFQLVPEILMGSRLLDGVATMALPGHWECGAYLYQGGYLDVVKQIGLMVREELDQWGVKRVITALDAVHYMFTQVHPERNNLHFNQEFINFHEWIIQKIQRGQISIRRKLDRTVTVHDNCYAKAGGSRYFDQARTLLDMVGVEVTEMAHHHEEALCCGFGRGAGWKRNIQIPID